MGSHTLKPIKIIIDPGNDYPLNIDEIQYTFRTLLTIAGFPWHFMPVNRDDSCDIYFGNQIIQPNSAKLAINMTGIPGNTIRHPIQIVNSTPIPFLCFDPADNTEPSIMMNDNNGTVIKNDIILSSFYLLSGWEEQFIRREGKDSHKIEDAFLFQNGLLHTPIVNQYALFIRKLFSTTHAFLPSWPDGKKYAVALSHDVDYPEIIPWIETGRYLVQNKTRSKLSKIRDILSKREHFFRFKDWIRLEKKHGMKSAFYFCGYLGSLLRYLTIAPDPFYDVRKQNFKDVMQMIDENNFEVGMHSSYFAYRSEHQFRLEKENIEQSLGKAILGNRHHYWHINPDNPAATAQIHKNIGFLYDSSISFEKHSGFRRGVCSPFHLYDRESKQCIDILQLSPTLMDDHLFGHGQNAAFSNYRDHINSLFTAVKIHGGVFTADYHVRVWNTTFFPNWGKSYEFLLDNFTRDGEYYCDTPINIVRHWMHREKMLGEPSICEL